MPDITVSLLPKLPSKASTNLGSPQYGDRIDLGLGRAPGTDIATARALRRHMAPEDSSPQDVQELIGYFGDMPEGAAVRAIPGVGAPVWILGLSLYGAQLAAHLGLPYAFASHFAPAMLEEALSVYRTTFKPSRFLSEPYAMIAAGVCAAETDAQAQVLRSAGQIARARLRCRSTLPRSSPGAS